MDARMMMSYNVDMVFCIDATGSMSPVINVVKENALNFYKDVMDAMQVKQKTINTMRVRVIAFRDYLTEGDEAIFSTKFFTLPDEADQLAEAVGSIEAYGGGDAPEDGLEALYYAIKSDWNREGVKRRNIIVVWSDAPTHEIGRNRKAPGYPSVMAKDFAELSEMWGDEQLESEYIKNAAKRLIIFAPDESCWTDLVDNWNNVIHYPSEGGKGLDKLSYQEIIDAIYNSI